MKITTAIKPLYDNLVKQNILEYFKSTDFIRLCNDLKIGDIYTEAYNEKSDDSDFSFLSLDEDWTNKFASFLNKLYAKKSDAVSSLTVNILIEYFKWTHRYVSIDHILLDLRSLGITSNLEAKLQDAWAVYDRNVLRTVEVVKSNLTGIAANGPSDVDEYVAARASLMRKASIKDDLPDFVKQHRTLGDFWQYIKHKFPTYQERRNFISESFAPLIERLEQGTSIVEAVIKIDDLYIRDVWQKALVRMNDDPEAAITSARTLLETVCKHILDNMSMEYDDTVDLPKLYKLTASNLNLSPDQHTEQIFKQILGGCQSIIDGLGSMRNKLSDAHGKSQKRTKPLARHAALAVNLSGSMCQFLLQTYEAKLSTASR